MSRSKKIAEEKNQNRKIWRSRKYWKIRIENALVKGNVFGTSLWRKSFEKISSQRRASLDETFLRIIIAATIMNPGSQRRIFCHDFNEEITPETQSSSRFSHFSKRYFAPVSLQNLIRHIKLTKVYHEKQISFIDSFISIIRTNIKIHIFIHSRTIIPTFFISVFGLLAWTNNQKEGLIKSDFQQISKISNPHASSRHLPSHSFSYLHPALTIAARQPQHAQRPGQKLGTAKHLLLLLRWPVNTPFMSRLTLTSPQQQKAAEEATATAIRAHGPSWVVVAAGALVEAHQEEERREI